MCVVCRTNYTSVQKYFTHTKNHTDIDAAKSRFIENRRSQLRSHVADVVKYETVLTSGRSGKRQLREDCSNQRQKKRRDNHGNECFEAVESLQASSSSDLDNHLVCSSDLSMHSVGQVWGETSVPVLAPSYPSTQDAHIIPNSGFANALLTNTTSRSMEDSFQTMQAPIFNSCTIPPYMQFPAAFGLSTLYSETNFHGQGTEAFEEDRQTNHGQAPMS